MLDVQIVNVDVQALRDENKTIRRQIFDLQDQVVALETELQELREEDF